MRLLGTIAISGFLLLTSELRAEAPIGGHAKGGTAHPPATFSQAEILNVNVTEKAPALPKLKEVYPCDVSLAKDAGSTRYCRQRVTGTPDLISFNPQGVAFVVWNKSRYMQIEPAAQQALCEAIRSTPYYQVTEGALLNFQKNCEGELASNGPVSALYATGISNIGAPSKKVAPKESRSSNPKEISAEDRKLIGVELFTSGGCPPCRMLKQNVFEAKNGDGTLQYPQLVPDEKYPTDSAENDKKIKERGVTSIPTIVITDSEGQVLEKLVGYQSPEILNAAYRNAINRAKEQKENGL